MMPLPVAVAPLRVLLLGAHSDDIEIGCGGTLLQLIAAQPEVALHWVVLSADGEPTLYHPGDALDGEPGEVDLLCVPVNAPWGKVSETVDFVRRVTPARAVVPIHEGLLVDAGREIYLKHVREFGADGGVEVLDLRGAGATEV